MSQKQMQDIELGIVRLEYGDAARPQRAVLTIETRKHYNGGLISDAHVYWVGNSCRSNMMSIGGDDSVGDYSKRLSVSPRTVKATQRAIDKQHADVFTTFAIAGLVEAAKAHYARYVRAGVDGMKNTYPAEIQSGQTAAQGGDKTQAVQNQMACEDCGFIIADNENYLLQDRTGFIYCEDCGDAHADVILVTAQMRAARGVSRG